MKVAFIHDRIVNIGGAEKVFFDIIKEYIKKYPNHHLEILTIFFKGDKNYINIANKKIKINYIFKINKNDKIGKLNIDYRNLMPIFPLLTFILSKKLKKFNPDKIIISSFAIAKNISIPKSSKYNYLYLHSPMQYIWEMYEEYINKFKGIKKIIYITVSKYLKKRDLYFSKKIIKNNFTIFYNSFYTQQTAKKIYKWKQGTVIWPKIDKIYIKKSPSYEKLNYYIYIGRIVKFAKELDKIITLFNQTKDNLLIIGSGPDKENLKKQAGSNIIFINYITDKEKLANILSKSKGLINITKESFGIVTAEALSLGIPIFGYKYGGTYELTNDNIKNIEKNIYLTENGILVEKKDFNTLTQAWKIFKNTKFNQEKIKQNFLKKYNQFDFEKQINKFI